jgi:hypothetical protein
MCRSISVILSEVFSDFSKILHPVRNYLQEILVVDLIL